MNNNAKFVDLENIIVVDKNIVPAGNLRIVIRERIKYYNNITIIKYKIKKLDFKKLFKKFFIYVI